MDDTTDKDPPAPPLPATARQLDRKAREAEALRANLRRRKDQARQRSATESPKPAPASRED